MEAKPGTYALVLRSQSSSEIQIGRWGSLKIKPGYYIYVGSAFGPGGVAARVSRHCRGSTSKHWHIDYLREFVTPLFAWYSISQNRLEHEWAQAISAQDVMITIKGFGCSDCKCESHLFFTTSKPGASEFTGVLGNDIKSWKCELT